MRKAIIILLYVLPFFCSAQKRGSIWCFGDSALIDFSDTSNITVGSSILRSRGSCASIADSGGQLLFYVGYDDDAISMGGPAYDNGEIINRHNQTMLNGDSIKMQLWYREALIINDPGNSNLFFVFTIGVTGGAPDEGLFYSVVDMSLDLGNGAVIQKNIQLQNFKCADGLTAVKHGNGRDWWLFYRRWDNVNTTFYKYLISPTGISSSITQNIGSPTSNGFSRIQFSASGNRIVFYNYPGLLELFDFDRCTGIISNPQNIFTENSQPPYNGFWSAEFSPSESLLYVTKVSQQSSDTARLYQFDLTSADIAGSIDTLWETSSLEPMGHLKLAPDGKIYQSSCYYFFYPYTDTTYNMFNMNLSVIEFPDSLGAACNLQPYSFNLGGKRTYIGLPNNPDYDLGPIIGSPCDSLGVGIEDAVIPQQQLNVFYHTGWNTAFVNAMGLNNSHYLFSIFDITGKQIFVEKGSISNNYFTKNLNCSGLAKGLYIILLSTENQNVTSRLLVH